MALVCSLAWNYEQHTVGRSTCLLNSDSCFCTWRRRCALCQRTVHSVTASVSTPSAAARLHCTAALRGTTEWIVDGPKPTATSLTQCSPFVALGQSADCAAATTPTRPSAKTAAAALPRNGRCVHTMDRTGGTRQYPTGGVLVCTQVPKMGPIPGMVIGTKEVEMESKERSGLS